MRYIEVSYEVVSACELVDLGKILAKTIIPTVARLLEFARFYLHLLKKMLDVGGTCGKRLFPQGIAAGQRGVLEVVKFHKEGAIATPSFIRGSRPDGDGFFEFIVCRSPGKRLVVGVRDRFAAARQVRDAAVIQTKIYAHGFVPFRQLVQFGMYSPSVIPHFYYTIGVGGTNP